MTEAHHHRIYYQQGPTVQQCSSCGTTIPAVAAWGFALETGYGIVPVCRACGGRDVPDLAKILDRLGPPTGPAEALCGVAVNTADKSTFCSRDLAIVPRRKPFELVRGDGRFMTAAEGEQECPTLAHALHEFYGTTPAPRPAPADQPAPVDEAEERRRDYDSHAISDLSRSLDPAGHGHGEQYRRTARAIYRGALLAAGRP
jgi:hypothetical protein